MILCNFELFFPIGAIYCAVSFCFLELQHFSKTTDVTFILPFSSAIVHFVKPNLSGGAQTNAKPVVICDFCTDAVKKSARNFGAKLKI